jgi:hypothetical protein
MSVLVPALVRRDALLHVNLSYSDSHEIFLLAPGDEAGCIWFLSACIIRQSLKNTPAAVVPY